MSLYCYTVDLFLVCLKGEHELCRVHFKQVNKPSTIATDEASLMLEKGSYGGLDCESGVVGES